MAAIPLTPQDDETAKEWEAAIMASPLFAGLPAPRKAQLIRFEDGSLRMYLSFGTPVSDVRVAWHDAGIAAMCGNGWVFRPPEEGDPLLDAALPDGETFREDHWEG